ncbi:MAG: hypothetical protein LBL49_09955 [Clostridiales Family XIII bacterium]|jgi:hypothetical protein|nr:hypothetical protein [Clostridiales Family XIII bacterium]
MLFMRLLRGKFTEFDPFYNEINLAHLRHSIAALNSGNGVAHDIFEASE